MARKPKGMTETELAKLCDSQVSDAIDYDSSELSLRRIKALEYCEGEMTDTPAEAGRSSVVSHDVADTIGWILPSLLRIFLASDKLALYEPEKPGDEPGAAQATDYVNYVLLRECNGYNVLHSGIYDGLLLGNGIIKHWFDKTPEYVTESYSGLPDDVFAQVVAPDEIEVLEHTLREEVLPDGMPLALHDVKVKKRVRSGRLRVVALPSEEFLIDRNATALNEEECTFCAHRKLRPRSELIAEGYDREKVATLPTHSRMDDNEERQARETLSITSRSEVDESMELVEVHECYIKADMNGDGVAELVRVMIGGIGGKRQILDWEEWGDDLPFTDIVPDPVPHRWRGRSVFDETWDIQRIRTVLLRQTLDNLYLQNHPQREAEQNNVINPDELVNPTLGGTVWVKKLGSTRELVTPFVAANSFQMMEYLDLIIQKRTGVGQQTMALDPETLQNQTATAANLAQSSAYSKIEHYARNIAEGGLKRLFRCLLKLMVQHQDIPTTIRLRDEWVQMEPSGWNANMDVTINTGLGSGSRDRDLAALNAIAMAQKEVILTMGPVNPICSIDKYAYTLRKLVETAGIKAPEQFFDEIRPEVLQQLQQAASQPQPDPKMIEAQAKMQIETQKAQADAQLAQQRAVADIETQRQAGMLKVEMMREEGAAKIQLAREEAAARLELAREEAMVKAQLRREEMMLEAELTAQANQMNAAVAMRQADTNIQRAE